MKGVVIRTKAVCLVPIITARDFAVTHNYAFGKKSYVSPVGTMFLATMT